MPNGAYFSESDFNKFQTHLVRVDSLMKTLAKKYRVEMRSNYRGRWPARRLWG